MLIVIQFPLADLRAFLDAEDVRIPACTNFSQAALTDTSDYGGSAPAPFLRSVGPLRKRRQGARFAGESLYFKGRRAIVFADGFRTVPHPRGGVPIPVKVFFRRFQAYQDLHQLARYELALLLDLEGRQALDGSAMQALLATCLGLRVTVPPHSEPISLVRAGHWLAAALLRATTYLRSPTPFTWCMNARTPAVLVEYGTQELHELPTSARTVTLAESQGMRLAVTGMRFDQVFVSNWFLSTGVPAVTQSWFDSDVLANERYLARQLRINLLRHHAEREVLAYSLDCVLLPDRLTIHGPNLAHKALRHYLVRAAARLSRSRSFGLNQTPITSAIAEIEVAAKAVDQANVSRYSDCWENLVKVLDVGLFTQLFDALDHLPMGSPLEGAQLKALLQQGQRSPRKIAVSYAHADDRLMKSFASHLEAAVRNAMVTPWDDRWIVAGSDWRAEIDQRFREADVVVLLVSEDFLKSTFCMQVEVPLVLERAARKEAAVVPVIVRPCEWESSILKTVQAVRPHGKPVIQWGNRTEAWRIVIHEILSAASKLAA